MIMETNEPMLEVKENIGEKILMEATKQNFGYGNGQHQSKPFNTNPVQGNVSSNQISQKSNKPVQKKDEKKKWMKRI